MSPPSSYGAVRTSQETPDLSESDVRESLNDVVLKGLPPVSLVLTFLFILFAIGHRFILPRPAYRIMIPTALLTSLFCFALYLRSRHPIPNRWTHPIAALIGAVMLANCLLQLNLTHDAFMTFDIMLVDIGAASFFLSWPWLIAIFCASALGWYYVIPSSYVASLSWDLATAIAVAGLVQHVRLGTYIQIERYRRRELSGKSELERTINALRMSEEKYRRLSEANFEGIFIYKGGEIIDFNPALEAMFGYAPEELTGMRAHELLPPDQRDYLARNLRENPDRTLEVVAVKKSGETFPVETRERIAYYGEERVGVVAIRDITERKRIETEIAQARDAALEAVRLKTQFMTNMSHEFRTPLNAVIGLTDLLLDTPLSPDQRDNVATVRQAGESLLDLVNNILDFSKIESGNFQADREVFPLRLLMEEIEKAVSPIARQKGIHFRTALDDGASIRAWGCVDRLKRILLHLIGNAFKFTDDGEVTLTVSKLKEAENRDWVRFVVRDTGIGIAKEDQHVLFNPFTQADGSTTRRYGGAGIGLAISKRLTELMGGEMGMESEPGEGSSFWIDIPFETIGDASEESPAVANPGDADRASEIAPSSAPSDPASTLESEPRPDLSPPSLRILVAEDNPVNQKVAVNLLKKLGYSVKTVLNGQEALDALERESFDLLLLDCQMPVMDGYETARMIRERERRHDDRHLAIIAMTANAMESDYEKCIASGMDAFLPKPVRMDALRSLLEKWIVKMNETPDSNAPEENASPVTASLDLTNLNELRIYQTEGEPDILAEIFTLYLRDAPIRMKAIETALERRDSDGIKRSAHSLKGASANVGAIPLANLAREMEERSDSLDIDRCEDLVERMKAEWGRVQIAIEKEVSLPSAVK